VGSDNSVGGGKVGVRDGKLRVYKSCIFHEYWYLISRAESRWANVLC
jgi:hypothetical protein